MKNKSPLNPIAPTKQQQDRYFLAKFDEALEDKRKEDKKKEKKS